MADDLTTTVKPTLVEIAGPDWAASVSALTSPVPADLNAILERLHGAKGTKRIVKGYTVEDLRGDLEMAARLRMMEDAARDG